METKHTDFSPKESLELIDQVISESKYRYEENGFMIMVWGIAVMVAGIGQFLLITNGLADRSYLIWAFTMIPMFIYSVILGVRDDRKMKKKAPKAVDVSGLAWFLAGSMAILSGFVFSNKFGIGFTTVMFLPFCVAAMVTALTIRKKAFVWLTLLATVLAYSALFLKGMYHPLLVAAIACVLFFIPGLLLRSDYKKRNHV